MVHRLARDVVLEWEQLSPNIHVCRTSALPSQRSDDVATCVGYAVATAFHETWQGIVGGRLVATGSLSVVRRAVEIEAHVRYGPRPLAALVRERERGGDSD